MVRIVIIFGSVLFAVAFLAGVVGSLRDFERLEQRRAAERAQEELCLAELPDLRARARWEAELEEDQIGLLGMWIRAESCSDKCPDMSSSLSFRFSDCGIAIEFSDGIVGNSEDFIPGSVREVCEVSR